MSMLLAFLPIDSVDFMKQTPSLSPQFWVCLQFAFLQMDHSPLPWYARYSGDPAGDSTLEDLKCLSERPEGELLRKHAAKKGKRG